MQRIRSDASYQFLSKRGPLGVAKVFLHSQYAERLKDMPFAGHCEFCMELLGKQETREYFVKKITEQA